MFRVLQQTNNTDFPPARPAPSLNIRPFFYHAEFEVPVFEI